MLFSKFLVHALVAVFSTGGSPGCLAANVSTHGHVEDVLRWTRNAVSGVAAMNDTINAQCSCTAKYAQSDVSRLIQQSNYMSWAIGNATAEVKAAGMFNCSDSTAVYNSHLVLNPLTISLLANYDAHLQAFNNTRILGPVREGLQRSRNLTASFAAALKDKFVPEHATKLRHEECELLGAFDSTILNFGK